MTHETAAPHTFIVESRELLRDMEAALLTLEQSPADREAISAVFRAMHTIKGSSGVFGFDVIVEFTHAMESVVEEIRAGRLAVDDVLVALLLTCGDHVAALIDCLEPPDRLERLEAARGAGADLLQQLGCYVAVDGAAPRSIARTGANLSPPEGGCAGGGAWHVSARFDPDVLRHGMDPLSFLRYLATLGEVRSVACLWDAMPDATAMDPQACYVGFELQLAGELERDAVEDAFEFVREDSSIVVLPPLAPLASWAGLLRERGEGERLEAALVASGALTPLELEQVLALQRRDRATQPAAAPAAASAPGKIPSRAAAEARSVRVHAGKLDALIDLVGELVIASAGVSLGARRTVDGELREATASMTRLVEEVRDAALSLRMVPIRETFNRFNRVVHDLGRELGKDAELVISGADTELDKSLVEKLSDPLMHLVRNALDHGIESPGQRLLRGKPACGRVQLHAYHETGSIVVEVVDDGGGLDRDRILARAQDAGLVQPGQTLADRDVYQLIMEPGFSTADTVTSVSGRGIGMDVVRRNIESLRGTIHIDSVAAQGTAIALRVPLTLAIIDGFLVDVGRSTYVIPLKMVVECLELPPQDRARVRESGYVNLRGEVLPLLRLRDVFDVAGDAGKRENVVVVNYGDQRAGFVVDALLGEFQTVIKPLGRLFDGLAGISGSTILGSGEVALILDVPGLVQRATQAGGPRQSQATASTVERG
ncbi:chemotaxis protein CheA [Ramlibacter sp. RBP-2]|uniref:Chemotaxis protein CheA n=1 Tax=Ramlibacter lithotrophicus TaxID=2606681 RepID=A0A7X6DI74_9BURK|nr:chemotaxis protein CheA [Ramlibacter lithotrophicus]NKE67503.1 chemotaxis protein CheA [Ramlibacter lithotrophicus]